MSRNTAAIEAARSKREAAEAAVNFAAPEDRATLDSALQGARSEELAAIYGAAPTDTPTPTPAEPEKLSQPDREISGVTITERILVNGLHLFGQRSITTITFSPEIAKARAANAQAKALRSRLQQARVERQKAMGVAKQAAKKDEYEAARARGEHAMKGMGKAKTEALERAAAMEAAHWERRKVAASAAKAVPPMPAPAQAAPVQQATAERSAAAPAPAQAAPVQQATAERSAAAPAPAQAAPAQQATAERSTAAPAPAQAAPAQQATAERSAAAPAPAQAAPAQQATAERSHEADMRPDRVAARERLEAARKMAGASKTASNEKGRDAGYENGI